MLTQSIEIEAADGVAEAYLVRPDEGAHPGILMYPDAFGLRPAFREMAERVASWGYTVLVPNYFYRTGTAEDLEPKGDPGGPLGPAAMAALDFPTRMGAVTPAGAVADAVPFVEALRSRGGVEGPIATVGYCFGGLQAIRAAETQPGAVAAVGAFHTGRLVTEGEESVHRHVAESRAEYYLGHADNDPSATPEIIAKMETALAAAGRPYTSELYEGTRHGYAVRDTAAYDEAAAERHYRELHALLERTIERTP